MTVASDGNRRSGRLTIVLPAYNEASVIQKTASILATLMDQEDISYELIFVNDGSRDETWKEIIEAGHKDSFITGICFSRNFGKEAAIYAGLSKATGDVVAVMDCDLQHPPQALIKMYRLWQQGYEVVEGVKTDRGKESFLHKFSAFIFYKIMSTATGMDMTNMSDFKMIDRKVVDILCAMPERNTFFRATSFWVGFRTNRVYFDVQGRAAGTSKWSTKLLIKYALNNISAFTTVPLQLVTAVGIFTFLFWFIWGVWTIINCLNGIVFDKDMAIILILLFCSSIMMLSMGIIGYYLSKIYDEIKRRPKYIISEIMESNMRLHS